MAKVKPMPLSGRRTKKRTPVIINRQRTGSNFIPLLDRLEEFMDMINQVRANERQDAIRDVVEYIDSIAEGNVACSVYNNFLKPERS